MAASVCFREKSGKLSRFGLSSDGRVAVDHVCKCLGADVVKWQDESGVWNYLEARRDDNLSFQVFTHGSIVDVLLDRLHRRSPTPMVLPRPNASYQEVAAVYDPSAQIVNGILPPYEPPWPELFRGVPPVDVDNYGINLELLRDLDRAFNSYALVLTWTEVKTGYAESQPSDPMTILVNRKLWDANEAEPGWEDRPSADERAAHLSCIWGWLSLVQGSSFKWLEEEKRVNAMRKVGRYSFIVRNWSDAVLADKDDTSKAVLGISFVERLTWHAGWRCQIDFYLWGSMSKVPYVQVVTDMKTGGIACVAQGPDPKDEKRTVLWRFVMYGMDAVEEFFRLFGADLPKSVESFTSSQHIAFQTDPPRVVFPHPKSTFRYA